MGTFIVKIHIVPVNSEKSVTLFVILTTREFYLQIFFIS